MTWFKRTWIASNKWIQKKAKMARKWYFSRNNFLGRTNVELLGGKVCS
jgi:hypothetical protein